MLSQRQKQVGQEVRALLSRILPSILEREPALKGIFITIQDVRMSADLRQANISISSSPNAMHSHSETETKAILKELKKISWLIRKKLAEAAVLKFVPALRFQGHDGRQEKLESLLYTLRNLPLEPLEEEKSEES